jgi:hypothetical protein
VGWHLTSPLSGAGVVALKVRSGCPTAPSFCCGGQWWIVFSRGPYARTITLVCTSYFGCMVSCCIWMYGIMFSRCPFAAASVDRVFQRLICVDHHPRMHILLWVYGFMLYLGVWDHVFQMPICVDHRSCMHILLWVYGFVLYV